MSGDRIRRLARNQRLAGFAGFTWGLAEGLFFFIVPDVYISFATLFSRRAGAVAWLGSIAGSVAAVTALYPLIASGAVDYPAFLARIPGISARMLGEVREAIALGGLPWTPFLAASGVPLKVYAAMAFSQGADLAPVLLWTGFARIVRIAPGFAVAAGVRTVLHRAIDRRPLIWCALLAAFWAAFYVNYFLRMGRSG